MPSHSRLDSVLEAIRARSARNRSAAERPSSRLTAPTAEALGRRQMLSVSSIQVQVQGTPIAQETYSGEMATTRIPMAAKAPTAAPWT